MDYYGKRLATCSSDRTVRVFDVVDGEARGEPDILRGCVPHLSPLARCPALLAARLPRLRPGLSERSERASARPPAPPLRSSPSDHPAVRSPRLAGTLRPSGSSRGPTRRSARSSPRRRTTARCSSGRKRAGPRSARRRPRPARARPARTARRRLGEEPRPTATSGRSSRSSAYTAPAVRSRLARTCSSRGLRAGISATDDCLRAPACANPLQSTRSRGRRLSSARSLRAPRPTRSSRSSPSTVRLSCTPPRSPGRADDPFARSRAPVRRRLDRRLCRPCPPDGRDLHLVGARSRPRHAHARRRPGPAAAAARRRRRRGRAPAPVRLGRVRRQRQGLGLEVRLCSSLFSHGVLRLDARLARSRRAHAALERSTGGRWRPRNFSPAFVRKRLTRRSLPSAWPRRERREDTNEWVVEDTLSGHSDWVRDVAWAPNTGLPASYIASAGQVRRPLAPLASNARLPACHLTDPRSARLAAVARTALS